MDTGESKRALIVGIFIALGIVIFVVGIFTLGSNQKTFGGGIQISAVFDDVAGLKKGGAVWFSGVKVGTINSIRFKGVSQVDVRMTVDKSLQSYIHRNAGVRISSDGLIGNKIIVIDGGSPQAPPVQDGDVLQAEKLLSTDDITKTLQQNNLNILAITTDFKKVSRQIVEGKGMVGALMGDTVLAMKFRTIVQNLNNTTAATTRMAIELDKFGAKLNSKGTLVDNLMTDTSTYRKLRASVNNLQQTTASAAEMVDNLNKTSSKLNNKDNILNVLLDDPKAAAKVRTSIDNLQQSSIKLNDDLEAAQHNFFLKGFFKDKAKKAKEDSLKKAGR
ncbi:MlaD family protein [Mucilaginibacter boryungensis]|uniref:MCE family protein n=1 Tax=Mucilaginibacter boryungensis TaxID=768480 RepID=A0ABR9XGN0_9SPHI|nr:MlaD family protein [Mucilaginibacter boryungensis]MBE9666543.1 MCE family protein [Mucilaginibacter boryungensis]